MAPSVVHAADASWNADTGSFLWATDTDWNPAAAPGSTATTTNTDTATFGNVITLARTITVDANRNIQNITFDGAGFSYNVSGGSLLLTSNGAITVNDGVAARQTVSAPITLLGDAGNYSFVSNDADAAQGLVISGSVTGVATASNVTTLILGGVNTGTSTTTGNAISGIVSDGTGGGTLQLVKEGAGTWTLSNANTFTGPIAVKEGTLRAGIAGAFGTAAKLITIGDQTLGADATLRFNNPAYGVANNINVAAGNGTRTIEWQMAGAGTTAMSGNIVLSKSLTLQQSGAAASANRRSLYSSAFSGTGDLTFNDTSDDNNVSAIELSGSVNMDGSLINASTGGATQGLAGGLVSGSIGALVDSIIQDSADAPLRLTGNNNSFVGSVEVREGRLLLPSGGSNQLSSSNVVSVDTGGVFRFASAAIVVDPTIAGLNDGVNGGGVVETGGTTARTLTLGGTGSYTFAGTIQNGTGTLALIKTGSGVQTLSGANTYGGVTAVNDGTLRVNGIGSGATSSGTGIGEVQVNGGRLGGTGRILGNVTVATNATLLAGDGVNAAENLELVGALAMGAGSLLELVLGTGGIHSTLTLGGASTFDTDQAVTAIVASAVADNTVFENIIIGVSPSLDVSQWFLTNPNWSGTFSNDGANIDLTVTAVPEPASLSLVALGGFVALRRRRR